MKLKSLLLSSLILLSACSNNPSEEYKVISKDSEGYYHASKLVKAEDGTFVPESFYNIKNEVVFTSPNVEIGDQVSISLDENGENPIIK
jgi:hypothetical protein